MMLNKKGTADFDTGVVAAIIIVTVLFIVALSVIFINNIKPADETTDGETENCIDLSGLSGDIACEKASEIAYYFDEFDGDIIKIKGIFYTYEKDNRTYYACKITDSSGTTGVAFEFIPTKETKLPHPGTEIIVKGKFGVYYEDEQVYCCLSDTKVEVLYGESSETSISTEVVDLTKNISEEEIMNVAYTDLYIGRTIRIKGTYMYVIGEDGFESPLCRVVISDEVTVSFLFTPKNEIEYPEEGTEIIVTGVLEATEIEELLFNKISNATVEVVE